MSTDYHIHAAFLCQRICSIFTWWPCNISIIYEHIFFHHLNSSFSLLFYVLHGCCSTSVPWFQISLFPQCQVSLFDVLLIDLWFLQMLSSLFSYQQIFTYCKVTRCDPLVITDVQYGIKCFLKNLKFVTSHLSRSWVVLNFLILLSYNTKQHFFLSNCFLALLIYFPMFLCN